MGIGELNEGPLHAALKATYAANGGETEVSVEGFVADAVRGGIIYEVQTGSFSGLTRKLGRLVESCPVVLVHPIARNSRIIKVDDQGEQQAKPRRSPKHGELVHIVGELVYIPSLLAHPNFSVEVVLTEEEEWRRYDPRKRRGLGGWRTYERRLLGILDSMRISNAEDLLEFTQGALPTPFTTRDLAGALEQPVGVAQQMAYCLRNAGAVEVCGKQGNSILYREKLDLTPS